MPFPGAVHATIGRRLLAATVDGALAAVMGGGFAVLGVVRAVTAARAGEPVTTVPLVVAGLLVALAFAAFECWLEGEHGVTAGKRALGLVTVSATGGRPIGVSAVARRYGRLAVDPRAWRRATAGAVVLDVRRGADPVLVLQPPVEVDEWPSLWVSRSGRAVDLVPRQASRPDAGGSPSAGDVLAVPMVDVSHAPGAQTSCGRRLPTQAGPRGRGLGHAPPPLGAPAPFPPPVGAVGHAPPPSGAPAPFPPPVDAVGHAPPPVGAPAPLPPPARAMPARVGRGVVLELWDGRRVPLTGLALVGRAPGPRPTDPRPEHLLSVRDPARAVSKTHLALGVDASGVWVRDHGSVNGTVVVLPDGVRVPCPPERRVRIPQGAAIAFGGFEIRIGGRR